MRKSRCWHKWETTDWSKSLQTGRQLPNVRRCKKCGKVEYRKWDYRLDNTYHSWWISLIPLKANHEKEEKNHS